MSPEQWNRMVELFHLLSEKSGEERVALLDSACSGDPELRLALEQMLRDDQASYSLLDEPPIARLADASLSRTIPAATGARFGRYEIVGLIGHGGMGEVWRGHDTELDRPVALKFLFSIADSSRLAECLTHEARAASALNHPNIVTIYEVIRHEETPIIVMELVEGTALRGMCGVPQPMDRVLSLGLQIARALAAAHAHGIVHRDVKPENILVRNDGYVKVLDFGLSRRLEEIASTPAVSGGTLRYMSPEQARDESISPASDIFSFGLVLYELATGRQAFPSDSPFEAVQAMLTNQPVAPSSVNPLVPPSHDSLILGMLAREPAARPSAEEVAQALNRLQLLNASSSRSTLDAATTTLARSSGECVPASVAFANNASAKKRRRLVLGVTAAALALVSCIWLWSKRNPARAPMEPLTAGLEARTVPFVSLEGEETDPSFSPDGLRVAFRWNGPNGDNFDIYVKPVGPEKMVRLTSDPADDFNPVWSPDGSQIAFLRRAGTRAKVLTVPSTGGVERSIGEIADSRISRSLLTWNPDGRSLIVSDSPALKRGGDLSLFRLWTSDGHREALTFPVGAGDFAPVYSPDGRSLAFLRGISSDYAEIQLRSPAGAVRAITSGRQNISSFDWAPDGRSIVYTLDGGGIWRVPVNGGVPRELLPAEGPLKGLTIARHGGRLAYVHTYEDLNIWRFPVHAAPHQAKQKLIASSRVDDSPRYSPDSKRIAFSSNRSGNYEIWTCENDGSNPVQLTSFEGPLVGSPNWSPDSRMIVFDSRVRGNADIYAVASTGGPTTRLTFDASEEILPAWSSDGASIYFSSNRSGDRQIWKMPAHGGPARQITFSGGFESMESHDGRYLYYTKGRRVPGIWRMPVSGGKEELLPELKPVERFRYWELGRGGVYFVRSYKEPRLEFFDFATGHVVALRTLPRPPSDLVRGLSVSPDGEYLLYTQADLTLRQIMLVENMAWQK